MSPATDHRARFDALYAAASKGDDPAAGVDLAWMLMRMRLDRQHPDVDRAWEAVLSAPWLQPAVLAPAALAYLAMHPLVRRALANGDSLIPAIEHLSKQRLFRIVVSRALVTPKPWQDFFLAVRALALQERVSVGALEWIAVQANLAEYVWPVDAELRHLRARVATDSAEPHDAVLLACFEHPGAKAQFAFSDTEGQLTLVRRLYSEPEEERAIARELSSGAKDALPQRAQRDQYETYPYPRWIAEPRLPAAIPPMVRARMKSSWWRKRKVLLAGCGTGQQCLAASSTYPDADICAFDFSLPSLAYAVRKCREAGIDGIAFEAADLLAYPKNGKQFDLVECIGVLHHLTDLDAGAAALGKMVRSGGLLRLAVYSAAARKPVRDLRALIAQRGLDGSLASLRKFRAELLAGLLGEMPPSILESPDLHSASGLHDLLFNACEHSLGATGWASLMARHGFELLCLDPPAATLAAAGAGWGWTPAQWEDYERTNPFAFASMYDFWFVSP